MQDVTQFGARLYFFLCLTMVLPMPYNVLSSHYYDVLSCSENLNLILRALEHQYNITCVNFPFSSQSLPKTYGHYFDTGNNQRR